MKRFWDKVDKTDGCWLWTAATVPQGYGKMFFDGKLRLATHISWYLEHSEWPADCMLHTCDIRLCVRPSHLFSGSRADNYADMAAKGRRGVAVGEANGNSKLTKSQVEQIKNSLLTGGELARLHGVSRQMVSFIRRGLYWKDVLPSKS